jgi:hypothetical protein
VILHGCCCLTFRLLLTCYLHLIIEVLLKFRVYAEVTTLQEQLITAQVTVREVNDTFRVK